MSDIKKEFKGIKNSKSFSIKGIQEAEVNLSLDRISDTSITIHGKVTDGTDPIAEAVVKLFDHNGEPFKHILTDADGEYILDNIPAGTYSISTVKYGYLMSESAGMTLTSNDEAEINLVCTRDEDLLLGAIAGILKTTDQKGNISYLNNGRITLLDSDGAEAAVTETVNDGEFAFYGVADGQYTLLSDADGYLPAAPMNVTISKGSIANLSISMDIDAGSYSGTVSGVIRNSSGYAAGGCFVGLYQMFPGVSSGSGLKQEILVATTKTNAEGKYLFGNVGDGQYVVKAKTDRV